MERFIRDNWTKNDYDSLILYLKSQADLKYREFHSNLVPNIPTDYIIGIRMPIMRKIGKAISRGNGRSFLSFPKDNYYEEALLYGIVLGNIKTNDYEDFCNLYDRFIPRINNWAVCDCCSGKSRDFKKYKEEYFSYIEKYLYSQNPWAVRYGIITMFEYKKEKVYLNEILNRLNKIENDFYYVKMAKAWLVAELFTFFSDEVYGFITDNNFDNETMKMTFQKIRDSYRVNPLWKDKIKEYKKNYLNNT